MLYLFGGYTNEFSKVRSSMESVDAKAIIEGREASWEILSFNPEEFPGRRDVMVAPIGPTEICVFGGQGLPGVFHRDGFIYNTTEKTISKVLSSKVKFSSHGNQSRMVRPGQIVALVESS